MRENDDQNLKNEKLIKEITKRKRFKLKHKTQFL